MVEPTHVDTASAGNNEDCVDKEKSPYGPWLLVSYGRQGSKNLKGRNSRIGTGNSGSNENMGGVGKSVGSGSAKKTSGGSVEANQDKTAVLETGIKGYPANIRSSSNANRGSGSRFDILSEDADITMIEGDQHGLIKVIGSSKNNDEAVLKEITNDAGYTGQSIPIDITVIDDESVDSASVLRQLHEDVVNFVAQPVNHMVNVEGLTHEGANMVAPGLDRNFDMVASDLEGALAVISE
ncbi:hypothetical protein Q3G72_010675 [Acer saccharum]|nr:hypothetical protein Q3G72_010675 [Acer saccharum]